MNKFFAIRIYIFVAILLASLTGFSQYPSMEVSAFAFNENLKTIQVKNTTTILPFKELAKDNFLLINRSNLTSKLINKLCKRYVKIHEIGNLHNSFFQKNIILIGSSFSKNEQELIMFLSSSNQITLINDEVSFSKSLAHIQVDHIDPLSFDQAIQIVFGALSKDQIKSVGRLSYVPAELAGFKRSVLEDSISQITVEGLNAEAYPGATVLVAKKGKVVYLKSFGYHDYDKIRPVRTDDIYDLASITKIAAATTSLMKLESQNSFKHQDSLGQYLPYFNRSNKGQLIFTDILTHQAKLKAWIPYWRSTLDENGAWFKNTFQDVKTENFPIQVTKDLFLHKNYKAEIYTAIAESPLRNKKDYLYSGLVFYLIPELVKNQSGLVFNEFLSKEIYSPLGANSFTFNARLHHSLHKIIPTEKDTFFRMVQIHGDVHDEGSAMMNGISGNAGLFSNAEDLAKLMQLFLQDGNYGGQQILKKGISREYTRCHFCAQDNKRGLGFDKPLIEYDEEKSGVAKSASPSSFGHSGYTGTFVWADPKNDLIYIFFSNRVLPTRLNRKLYTMNIRPRMHQAIYDAIN